MPAIDEVCWLRVRGREGRDAILEWSGAETVVLPQRYVVGRLQVGRRVLVRVFRERGEVLASMHLNDFLSDTAEGLTAGDRVSLVIADRTDLGVKAVVNHRFWGLLYGNELFRPVRTGDVLEGFVKAVREDERLDLTLTEPGRAAVERFEDTLLERLEAAGGFLPFTDRSAPEVLYAAFGVSKKHFKQAVGGLYRERLVTLHEDGLRLVAHSGSAKATSPRPGAARDTSPP